MNEKFFAEKWPGMTIVDAPSHWVVPIELTTDDIEEGVPRDGEHCAFAQACNRTYGSTHAVFTRRIAYLDLAVGKKEAERLGIAEGTRVVYRFALPRPAQKAIEQFDTTGTAPTGQFTVTGPPESLTIAHMRSKRDKTKQREYMREYIKRPRADVKTLAGVRYGNGYLKFREAAR